MEAIISAAIGAAIGVVGGFFLGRHQRRAEHTQRYSDKPVEGLSRAKIIMQGFHPDGLIMEGEPGQSWNRISEAMDKYDEAKLPLTRGCSGPPQRGSKRSRTQADADAFQLMKATTIFVYAFSPAGREHMSTNLSEYRNGAVKAFDTFQASIDKALALVRRE